MRLNAEAVVCTGNREWYYGSMSGFSFFIKDRIISKDRFKEPNRFKTASKWMQELGYKTEYEKLTKTLLKSVVLRDVHNTNSVINNQRGILKLFIGNTVMTGEENSKKYNVLCANCLWTCKQPKDTLIYSCKSFKNGSPTK